MSKPQFQVGDYGDLGGVEWRIVQGRKSASDLVVQIRCQEWVKPKMALSFLLADFHAQSEDILRDEGYLSSTAQGGQFFLNRVRCAIQVGWEWASNTLERERGRRRLQEAA